MLNKILESHFLFAFISILLGFMFGAIMLLVVGLNPIEAYGAMLYGIFSRPQFVARVFIHATPIIMTGLGVAFAFRTGLFNIGAEGQYILGSLAAVWVGVYWELPPIILPIVCILAGALAGAACGSIAGLLKATRGVSEVITCIMLNWSALFFSNWVMQNTGLMREASEASHNIQYAAMISLNWANLGIDQYSPGILGAIRRAVGPATPVNFGFFVAVLAVIVVHIIINKTTLGYRLRAVGFNKNASLYGGISVARSVMISMAISGALAGIGGALMITGVQRRIHLLAGMEGFGFDGLAVSMIGANNPIGVLFSGLFFSALRFGSSRLTLMGAPSELADIIMGCIIYFIAISNAIRMVYLYFLKKRGSAHASN